jgi:hypothetical protein
MIHVTIERQASKTQVMRDAKIYFVPSGTIDYLSVTNWSDVVAHYDSVVDQARQSFTRAVLMRLVPNVKSWQVDYICEITNDEPARIKSVEISVVFVGDLVDVHSLSFWKPETRKEPMNGKEKLKRNLDGLYLSTAAYASIHGTAAAKLTDKALDFICNLAESTFAESPGNHLSLASDCIAIIREKQALRDELAAERQNSDALRRENDELRKEIDEGIDDELTYIRERDQAVACGLELVKQRNRWQRTAETFRTLWLQAA